jgi:hypothetical protein
MAALGSVARLASNRAAIRYALMPGPAQIHAKRSVAVRRHLSTSFAAGKEKGRESRWSEGLAGWLTASSAAAALVVGVSFHDDTSLAKSAAMEVAVDCREEQTDIGFSRVLKLQVCHLSVSGRGCGSVLL